MSNDDRRKRLSSYYASVPVRFGGNSPSTQSSFSAQSSNADGMGVAQTIDDLLLENVLPGDLVLFDRRCYTCASGPLAAAACLASKYFTTDYGMKGIGPHYDHVAIVVPNPDGSSVAMEMGPYVLEVSSGSDGGFRCMPLRHRLGASGSRNVAILPLCVPGETMREGDSSISSLSADSKVQEIRSEIEKDLSKFMTSMTGGKSKSEVASRYTGRINSTLTITGALSAAAGLKLPVLPISPSAFLVVGALNEAGVTARNNDKDLAQQVLVADFLNDHRYYDERSVQLRPGFRFGRTLPVRQG
eukprot:CAMPEP_0113320634 /NCGR_PEP_ID=MMETSP0010_2-20120614/14383_1 /TAXON_ID=216773 ORGANISM="Corethron hystrix, Strain 308" /NCGR_SAMPLE_ID=MMETSP0010_2 /ASSEMBLY_ACC=CAM_ASM_000155 /LENGTH=300 /DNA_ID=CAMNT_0000178493 /DNA_START=1 /DNA_END=903 /DNA_ORIENTATION=+ /assembly_acc=CAM_ASM_000155